MFILLKYFFSINISKTKQPELKNKYNKKKIPCILCGSVLSKGENLKSEKFTDETETIVHLYGCPNCYGDGTNMNRTCPVCKKLMLKEDYLIGKMWKTKKGKLHLHISGCTSCKNIC